MTDMKITQFCGASTLLFALTLLSACSTDKLEARLQADPHCKPSMNTKTGALMPCPGSDKQFYQSIPALNVSSPKVNQDAGFQSSALAIGATPSATLPPKATSALVECKPQLHQKSGSLMPCPAP